MIRVGKTINELDLLAKEHLKVLKTKLSLDTDVSAIVSGATGSKRDFYHKVEQNLEDIITGHPDKLESLISRIEPFYLAYQNDYHAANPLRSRRKNNSALKNEVLQVFNYSLFTTLENGKLAYNLSDKISSNVCLYCNTQYTFTIRTTESKTRPQFDHFFKKSHYPYLALSFYNLIPSCYVCNANLKTTKNFKFSTHIHPYMEDINDTHSFQTNVNAPDYMLGLSGFNLEIKRIKNSNKEKGKRAERNLKTFIINDQYKNHEKYAGEIIKKAYIYNESKLKELLDSFEIGGHKLFTSEQEILDLVFGDYIYNDKLHTRTLSKLTRDILHELKIKV